MKMLIAVLFGLLFFACAQTRSQVQQLNNYVKVENGVFKDSLGRQVIFHGINLVNKNESLRFRGSETEADFERMKNWGFNTVRLGINWSALEPEPGVYDDSYLEHIDQFIAWSKKHGVYVLLDMHQDLYGSKFGNGAPAWATFDNGLDYEDMPVWSDAYFESGAVKASFDNFWANKPAVDGVGVQTHLINAWRYVADRYSSEPTVIGFDLLNEPFIGSPIDEVLENYLKEVGGIYQKQGTDLSFEELFEKWTSSEGREEIMNLLVDTNLFKQVIDSGEPIYEKFEKEKLMPFFQAATDAIREVNTSHIIFTEPSVSANTGNYSHISLLTNNQGQQAFAAHAYDLVMDTDFAGQASLDRLGIIHDRIEKKQKELNIPLFLGEWGAFYSASESVITVAAFYAKMQEKLLCSDTYWHYSTDLAERAFFPYLNRAYPQYTAGELLAYEDHSSSGVFKMKWIEKEDNKQTTIYIPGEVINVEDAGNEGKLKYVVENYTAGVSGVLLQIMPIDKTRERTITVKYKR